MTNVEPISSFTISVFTRHSVDCPYHNNPQWKRCNCRKSLYIRERGKTTYVSAKARSWEHAERVAQAERDKRDPVKIESQKIAEREAAKTAKNAVTLEPLGDAFDQWLAGMKGLADSSLRTYRSAVNKIKRWADRVGVVYVSDVTPAMLDEWRSSWAPDAGEKDKRLNPTSQAQLLMRIKAFFRWATGMEFTARNPIQMLKAITPDESKTWPLTPKQFDQLMASTFSLDDEANYKSAKVGQHLRALFLVQRWTGLRVGDVLILPKAALQGNRLSAVMRKKRNRKPAASLIECVLPDHVVEALNSLPRRPEEHPNYFFWSRTCDEDRNTNKWLRKVDRLNKHLSFTYEDGKPMEFHTHMLRDTFVVEMLLAGVPLEKVSKLVGHESVAMTERYYAKWTKNRKQQLEDEAIAAMRRMGATVTV